MGFASGGARVESAGLVTDRVRHRFARSLYGRLMPESVGAAGPEGKKRSVARSGSPWRGRFRVDRAAPRSASRGDLVRVRRVSHE